MAVRGAAFRLGGIWLALGALVSCSDGENGDAPPPVGAAGAAVRVYADPAPLSLSVADVESVIARAAAEATARRAPATIAVTDRVGNVLAVYAMTDAPDMVVIDDNPSGDDARNGGVQGVEAPSTLAAISKALTGAYLSSGGNAFSSRTASMIVQEHFPPAPGLTVGLEAGPLFGVQFSQLPCSDLMTRYAIGAGAGIGPQRAPLGLSADPGGFPLYKDGVLVGGVGVSADETYSFDTDVTDVDQSDEEAIALAAAGGLAAPEGIRADRIFVDGTSLRFSDAAAQDLVTNPSAAPGFAGLTAGSLVTVRGYFGEDVPAILPGTAYGTEASGIRVSGDFASPDTYVLSDGFGSARFAPRDGTEAAADALTAMEVEALLEDAFAILSASRAQIRQPLGSRAQVSISVVDTRGQILGIVRSPDAPIFGIDVSLQKARTATFFSSADAGSDLLGAIQNPALNSGALLPDPDVRDVVGRVRTFLGNPAALTGGVAFADRSGGNLARPFFPDGEAPNGPGPLSVSIETFNPFDTGLQAALVVGNLAQHIGFVLGIAPDTPSRCGFLPPVDGTGAMRLQNGLQIFPGSVPIYRGDTLVGGIGVSGDGIDQDDMISFLGVHNAAQRLGTLNNAPPDIRADRIVVPLAGGKSVRLRYVNCPFAPFVDSDAQNVCQGK